MKVYYSHAESHFGSSEAGVDLDTMGRLGFNVVDPAWDNIRADVRSLREDGKSEEEIYVYLGRWVDQCEGLIFRRNSDGTTAPDVAAMVKKAQEDRKPVLELPTFSDEEGGESQPEEGDVPSGQTCIVADCPFRKTE